MKKKKIIALAIIAVFVIAIGLFVGTGFTKNPNVALLDYTVSEDGTELSFSVGIPFSIGYVRGFKDVGGGVKPHYLDFYNTFGVINSSWGAQFDYVLELDEDDTEVYFNRADGGYELVLKKDADTGEWIRPTDNVWADQEDETFGDDDAVEMPTGDIDGDVAISNLTMRTLKALVERYGEDLTWDVFEDYYSEELITGLHSLRYPIDEDYYLVLAGSIEEKPTYIHLVSEHDHEKYIDVRTGDIDDFLNSSD